MRKAHTLRSLDPSEEQIHRAVAQWVLLNEARYPALRLMFHAGNGAHKTAAQRGIFKALLQRPGVPDLMLPVARWGFNGLAIELKSTKGRASEHQATYLARLVEHGWRVALCRSVDHALREISGYLEPMDLVELIEKKAAGKAAVEV